LDLFQKKSADIKSMKLIDLLGNGAAISSDKIAVTHDDRNITYYNLLRSISILSQYLQQVGLNPDSRVGILFENSIEYILSFFAVSNAGFVPVPLDTSLMPDKFHYILNDCRAEGLIIQNKFARNLAKILAKNSHLKLVVSDKEIKLDDLNLKIGFLPDILAHENSPESFEISINGSDDVILGDNLTHNAIGDTPNELAAIFYTSGSNGSPKGVMLSHRNLVSNTLATVEYLKLTSDDSIMVVLPFYYIYGNSLMLTHLVSGGRIVIDNRFAFPPVVLDSMIREKVSGFSGVPSNFMILLNNSNFISEKLPNLRYLTQAGGGMAPDIIRKVISAFPDKEVCIMYGQTEASPRVSYLPPEMLLDNIGSIGIPVPGVTIRVVDENGQEVPTGQVGEIIVSGDCVMTGYWNRPEEQAQVLKNGWLYTGDLAKRDENGLLYIVSRKKEIIKVGGNRVSAREIEEKLLEHGKISEAAIIGVADDILGEAIKAFVVLNDGELADIKEILDYCRVHLAIHKVPKYIEFLDALPKYQSGKVNKQKLKN